MRGRILLFSLLLTFSSVLALVYNYMVYAYIPAPPVESTIRSRYMRELEADCIGWGIPNPRYQGFTITGGNPLCIDTRGRTIYEYARFNITLPGPGLWVYEDVFYFYVNVRAHRLIEVVVEKPINRHRVYLVFRRGNITLFTINATEIDRYVFMASPGVSYYSISIIVDTDRKGRDDLRLGVYVSFHSEQ